LNKSAKLANLVFYRELIARRLVPPVDSKGRWTRVNRRAIAETLKGSLSRQPGTALQTVRVSYPTRRAQKAPGLRLAEEVRPCLHERTPQLHASMRYGSVPTRQANTHRTAADRTSRITYQKLLAIPHGAVATTRRFMRMRRVQSGKSREKVYTPSVFGAKRVAFSTKLSKISPGIVGVIKQLPISRADVAGTVSYFKARAGRRIIRSAAFARTCALYTKFYRQAPFETHRSRL